MTTFVGTGVRGFSGDGEIAIRARLTSPRSLAFSSDGMSLFIADTGNHRIRVVNLNTNVITTLAGNGDTEFNGELLSAGQTALAGPEGVAVSPFDMLFIADTGHHLVWRTAVSFLTARQDAVGAVLDTPRGRR